ncbi:hypothetical protein PHJA_001624600 [Phtheirospermum japonicum]|uniref:Uncharacterized protein n=1 Tax=Phtheirospermum japonicum TaxID=374723 RepID=A0A830C9D1_9LAMI|nr:hypothetical protein PHJA_001624600 [Phtheirospermum japonicum]
MTRYLIEIPALQLPLPPHLYRPPRPLPVPPLAGALPLPVSTLSAMPPIEVIIGIARNTKRTDSLSRNYVTEFHLADAPPSPDSKIKPIAPIPNKDWPANNNLRNLSDLPPLSLSFCFCATQGAEKVSPSESRMPRGWQLDILLRRCVKYGFHVKGGEEIVSPEIMLGNDCQYVVRSDSSLMTANNSNVNCCVKGDTGLACNSAGMIDRYILGVDHLYAKPMYRNLKECNISSHGQVPETLPSWYHTPFDPRPVTSFGRATRLIAKYRPTMHVLPVVIPRLKTNQLKWSFSGAFEVDL